MRSVAEYGVGQGKGRLPGVGGDKVSKGMKACAGYCAQTDTTMKERSSSVSGKDKKLV